MNVAADISLFPPLHLTSDRMRTRGTDRRDAYNRVGDMSRDVGVMSLNQGPDFDGPFTALIDAATAEIDWELAEASPLIRESVSTENAATRFSSAHYVQRHAPTKLHHGGPRWYERIPVISRVATIFDHANEYLATDHYRRRS